MYAVINLWHSTTVRGYNPKLVADVIREGFSDIKKAEAFRSEWLESHKGHNPQMTKVIQYEALD